MSTMASQITSLMIVYSIVYSGTDQRKHKSSASLAFDWELTSDWWIPRAKGQWCGKCFHLIMSLWALCRASHTSHHPTSPQHTLITIHVSTPKPLLYTMGSIRQCYFSGVGHLGNCCSLSQHRSSHGMIKLYVSRYRGTKSWKPNTNENMTCTIRGDNNGALSLKSRPYYPSKDAYILYLPSSPPMPCCVRFVAMHVACCCWLQYMGCGSLGKSLLPFSALIIPSHVSECRGTTPWQANC